MGPHAKTAGEQPRALCLPPSGYWVPAVAGLCWGGRCLLWEHMLQAAFSVEFSCLGRLASGEDSFIL